MPVHDWTRVNAGTYHDFHNAWITELRNALNGGVLPVGYYALGEQRSGDIGPDVLALHARAEDAASGSLEPGVNPQAEMIAVAQTPPRVSMTLQAEEDAAFYIARRRTLVIYHATGDRIVALIEITSPGNKHSHRTVGALVEKAIAALNEGFHLVVIDLFSPGLHDCSGINGAIWESISGEALDLPPDRPLSLAAYCAKSPIAAYIEPVAVGLPLVEMPLFLTPEHYVNIPLEATYMLAWRGVPQRWRNVIQRTRTSRGI